MAGENGTFLSELVFHEEVMKELQAENYGVTVGHNSSESFSAALLFRTTVYRHLLDYS